MLAHLLVVLLANYRVVAPPPPTPLATSEGLSVIYLNRDGGTYTPGFDDSSLNRSSIIYRTVTISPWTHGDALWNQLVGCVREMYGRFDVAVTDVDPAPAPHLEAVVAGHDYEMDEEAYGIAPFADDCSPIERAIVFTFSETIGPDLFELCWTTAQEIAHAYGLDHELLCEDPMTYLEGCGPKSFQDVSAPCGEYFARACHCGEPTQNSVALLTEVLGPRRDGAGLGEACESGADCESGQCAGAGDEGLCVTPCAPSAPDDCPDGFHCTELEAGTGVCWPKTSGGCAVAGGGAALPLLALLALRSLRRRRRRRWRRASG